MVTTETGHAKIMANFKRLILVLLKLGKDYLPSNPLLLIEALTNASSNGTRAMDAVGTAALAYRTSVKQRESVFLLLNKLVTRVFNTLKASDGSSETQEIAELYVRKIQGRRARPKRTEEEKKADIEAGIEYREVSASQMSFDSRTENFTLLVKLVASTPSYAPNETDLKVDSLMSFLEDLKKKNDAVVTAASDLYKARALRNEILYREGTGITDIALDAKSYLKGAFGSNSPQYKEVSGLSFKKLNRN